MNQQNRHIYNHHYHHHHHHTQQVNKADDDQQHRQKQQLNCFNPYTKQLFELSYYISLLVSSENCSVSAFIVILVYLDRVDHRCNNFQVTQLSAHDYFHFMSIIIYSLYASLHKNLTTLSI